MVKVRWPGGKGKGAFFHYYIQCMLEGYVNRGHLRYA